MQKVFLKVVGALLELPHVSIGFAKFEEVHAGWVVRKKDAADFEGETGMTKAVHIALETTNSISGFIDDEVELWDVVYIFDNEEDATRAAIANSQSMIYQIETSMLKWLD